MRKSILAMTAVLTMFVGQQSFGSAKLSAEAVKAVSETTAFKKFFGQRAGAATSAEAIVAKLSTMDAAQANLIEAKIAAFMVDSKSMGAEAAATQAFLRADGTPKEIAELKVGTQQATAFAASLQQSKSSVPQVDPTKGLECSVDANNASIEDGVQNDIASQAKADDQLEGTLFGKMKSFFKRGNCGPNGLAGYNAPAKSVALRIRHAYLAAKEWGMNGLKKAIISVQKVSGSVADTYANAYVNECQIMEAAVPAK